MPAILTLLIPATISDAQLTSTNVPEADYTVWNSTTTYGLGVRCMKNHRIFESQVATGNTNKDPVDPINQFGTTVYWNDIGPTNRYAMFDGYRNTQTSIATTLTVVIKAGAFNWIALDGLEAKTINVSVKDAPGGRVIFTHNSSLRGNRPSTYWQYWFNGFDHLKSKIISGIPPYANMELTLTLSASTGVPVKCGMLGIGMAKKMGQTQQGVEAKPKSYGYVKVDQYGQTAYKAGKKALDITATALISRSEMRQVQDMITDALGVPCLVSCSESSDYSALNVWGFISGKVVYKTETTSEVSITQEGVI